MLEWHGYTPTSSFHDKERELLATMGHDVLTVQAAGNANLGIPDEAVLAFAITDNRAVLTLNRGDFIRLHKANSEHTGIVVCTNDSDRSRLATHISEAITAEEPLPGKLIRVVRDR